MREIVCDRATSSSRMSTHRPMPQGSALLILAGGGSCCTSRGPWAGCPGAGHLLPGAGASWRASAAWPAIGVNDAQRSEC
jgi:hypothetical protein